MMVLISPVSYEEAASIVDCNVDILDVKSVDEGALGAQLPWQTQRVVELAVAHGIKTSAALGDLPLKPGTAALAALGAAHMGLDFVKAGLLGANGYKQALDMMDAVHQAVRMVNSMTQVVAAGYADYRCFGGLGPADLVRAARDSHCSVVMVDTAMKDGRTLFDHLTMDELKEFVHSARQAGLQVALAGSLRFEHANRLLDLNPDIVGVRGAVCADSDRKSPICPSKARQFLEIFHSGRISARIDLGGHKPGTSTVAKPTGTC